MNKIKVFENKKVRTAWNEETEDWYFSVIDVIEILTESENPRRYWSDLKRKLKNEGSELYDNIVQLKLKSPKDGKRYKTDVADAEQLLRIIQSIPSPKADLNAVVTNMIEAVSEDKRRECRPFEREICLLHIAFS